MSATRRLVIPTLLFTVVLIALIAVLANVSLREQQATLNAETARRVASLAAVLGHQIEDAKTDVALVNRNQLVVDGVQTESQTAVLDVLTPFIERTPIGELTVYDRRAEVFADGRHPERFGRADEAAPFVRHILAHDGTAVDMIRIGTAFALVAGARIDTINGVVGATVARTPIDETLVRMLALESGAALAIKTGNHWVGAQPSPAQTLVRVNVPPFDAAHGVMAALVVDDAVTARQRRDLLLSLAAVAVAGLFAIAMSLRGVRAVAASERKLVHEATHDPLTGLPNRRAFGRAIDDALSRPRRGGDLAVLFIDLDHFKVVNDTLGHAAGDAVLRTAAERIGGAIRTGDVVARIGGDEFAVLLHRVTGFEEAMPVVNRVRAALAEHLAIKGRTVSTAGSIGVAFASAGYANADDLLRDADAAAYRAKATGRSRAVVFDAEMRANAHRRRHLDSELRTAVDRRQFRLVYQPIRTIEDRKLYAFEALLRWEHPDLGILEPHRFLDVARESGLLVPIGRLVIADAIAQLAHWRRTYPRAANLLVSINIAAEHLRQPDFHDELLALCASHGVPPRAVALEVTEEALGEPPVPAAVRDALRANAVGVWLDDFGTGASSLTAIRDAGCERVKVDRSFITGRGRGLASPQIVATLLALARSLAIPAVAEGIEDMAQCDELQGLGCRYGQGLLFGAPADAALAEVALREDDPSPARAET